MKQNIGDFFALIGMCALASVAGIAITLA